MQHRVVIIQSNYVPWKGYFDLLHHADTVVFLDTVQSTKNDWRNRNQIKTQAGKSWLTVPIRHSNALRVREVEIAQPGWATKHFRTLSQAYGRAPFASQVLPAIGALYEEAAGLQRLSEVNRVFIRGACAMLGISTPLLEVERLLSDGENDALEATARLVEICRRLGATSYLTGPAARAYLEEKAFAAAGVRVEWFDYHGYPEYQQLHGVFDHAVSILDLLLMTGPGARAYALRPAPQFLERSMA